jgi:hypothetical protein
MTVYKLLQSGKTTIKKTLFSLFIVTGYGTRIPKIIYYFVYVNLSDKLPFDSSEWSAQQDISHLVKFDGNNFHELKFGCRLLLETRGLLDVIYGI